jgi:hypothetical protein
MRGLLSPWPGGTCGALIATALLSPNPAAAQSAPAGIEPPALVADTRSADSAKPLLVETVTRVVTDPTTYALPAIVYAGHRLDWDTSQKLFAYGYFEVNPQFTVSGRTADVPISFAAGKRKILRYSLSTIGNAIINNAACAVVERRLIERAPQRRKLVRSLGWIERGLVTAYWSQRLTHNQVVQWRDNQRVIGELRALHGSPPAGSQ